MQMTANLFVLMPLTALAGVALLAWSRRGRRVDDHPLCRRCGFDLTGRPETSDRCSECGAVLTRRRAIRVGHRRKRSLGIVLALLMIVTPLAATGRFVWTIFSDPNPDQLKPVWWLHAEATHFGGIFRNGALDELIRRERGGGTLEKEEIDPLLDVALKEQADLSRPWFSKWGDFIETAKNANDVSAERWKRYLRQSLGDSLKFEVRPRVRRGDLLPARIVYRAMRVGSAGTMVVSVSTDLTTGEDKLFTWTYSHLTAVQDAGGQWTNVLRAPAPQLSELADGRHTVQAAVRLLDFHTPELPVVQEVEVRHLKHDWTLLPAGESSVSLRADASLTEKMRSAVRTYDLQVNRHGSARIWVDVFPTPANVAFDVVLRRGLQEHNLGQIVRAAGQPQVTIPLAAPIPGDVSGPVEIVFRPSSDAAAKTVDLLEIWDGEVVVPQVPVVSAGDAARAAAVPPRVAAKPAR